MLIREFFADNLRTNAKILKDSGALIAVVKSDAYGIGAERVIKTLADLAMLFAVGEYSEAKILRQRGVTEPLLILSPVSGPADTDAVYTVDSPDCLKYFSRRRDVMLRFDLDGSAVGCRSEDAEALFCACLRCNNIRVSGIYSHMPSLYRGAKADRFAPLVARAKELFGQDILCHIGTSAVRNIKNLRFDALRVGTALYGLPSHENETVAPLLPVAAVRSRIERIHSGGELSLYGCSKTVCGRVASVSAGYGQLHALIGLREGCVLVNGQRAPIIGTPCMCHTLIELNDADVHEGDKVTFIGSDGGESISAAEFASFCGIPICRCEGVFF